MIDQCTGACRPSFLSSLLSFVSLMTSSLRRSLSFNHGQIRAYSGAFNDHLPGDYRVPILCTIGHKSGF